MSTAHLTTNPYPAEQPSAPAPELESIEHILLQCQLQIDRHTSALSHLLPQQEALSQRARTARWRRDHAHLLALIVPTRFFSIEDAASESINNSSPEESQAHSL